MQDGAGLVMAAERVLLRFQLAAAGFGRVVLLGLVNDELGEIHDRLNVSE